MTSYLQIEALTKSFGNRLLLENISFGIAQGEKTGLIAPNGSGKTTLLNILAGKENYDSGTIVFRNNLRTGYLQQSPPPYPPGLTIMQAINAGENELKAKQILTQLNITHTGQNVEELSGGQLKRVALAAVLADEPELLLLDEPTNHLDPDMIEWLENYLERRNISLLTVTHDRYFLDRVCNSIIEIDRQRIYRYKGNYSYFLEKKQERTEAQNAGTERAANLLRKELEWMNRQPQARATKAKHRIDTFHELQKKARPTHETTNINLGTQATYIGNKIFEAVNVTKHYGNTKILENFSYTFARYEKMGITGANGTGKTTFIKMLTGEIPPDSGHFDIGKTVRFGHYKQEGLTFNQQMKVIDTVQNIAEYIDMGNGHTLGASQFLNHFLFPPDKQHDYVHKLSGGEKRRLYLCTVLMKNPNFLLLDEPTNDLDITTLNILEEYLRNFRGCLIVVSHDRYFMDKITDHLLIFRGNANITDFPGNYTLYRTTHQEHHTPPAKHTPTPTQPRKTPAPTHKLTFRERRELDQLETTIPRLETEKNNLENTMSSGHLNNEQLHAHARRITHLIQEIDTQTTRWLELSERL